MSPECISEAVVSCSLILRALKPSAIRFWFISNSSFLYNEVPQFTCSLKLRIARFDSTNILMLFKSSPAPSPPFTFSFLLLISSMILESLSSSVESSPFDHAISESSSLNKTTNPFKESLLSNCLPSKASDKTR